MHIIIHTVDGIKEKAAPRKTSGSKVRFEVSVIENLKIHHMVSVRASDFNRIQSLFFGFIGKSDLYGAGTPEIAYASGRD